MEEPMAAQHQAALIMASLTVKPALKYAIYEHFQSFKHYFDSPPAAVPEPLHAPLHYYCRHRQALERQAQEQQNTLHEQGISLCTLGEANYPQLLAEIHRPPLILYLRGNVSLLSMPQVAIVGSRNASQGGIQLAETFARELAATGFTVTSGLALGIDGAAHCGALSANAVSAGSTVAVLGSGVDVVYPRRHQQLYDQIMHQGGVLVSEYPPQSKPLRHHFPQRNRIISGLAAGVLVIEAALKSGSLITARMALEQGREVFAVPGSIHNPLARGCHQLIREGATLTETLSDMVSQLGGLLAFQAQLTPTPTPAQAPLFTGDTAAPSGARPKSDDAGNTDESLVLNAIGFDPVDFDTLSSRLSLDVSQLTTTLMLLELQGIIENNGSYYLRLK